MKDISVSIIFVNYNTVSYLCKSIDSVLDKTQLIDFEIIVVDNNSIDHSKEIIHNKYGTKVIYLPLSENIGFGRANNEGIKIARGRNIFLLNPDTILINNAVKILSDFLDQHVEVGVCGGNLYDENENPTISFVRILPSIKEELDQFFFYLPSRIRYGKNKNFNYTKKNINVKAVIGADMMIRKKVLEETGVFDPDFFMYHEELELCHRISKANYKIKSVPDAKIIHLEGKSLSCDLEKRKKMLNARKLFYKKIHGNLYHFMVDCIFYQTAALRIIVFCILGNREKIRLWKYILKNIRY